MSALAVILIILIFKSTGVLDKILKKLGYVKEANKSFLRTNEEFEHSLDKNETEDENLRVRDSEFVGKQDPKLEDYDDTPTQPTTIADVTPIGSNSTLLSNMTTVYYYLV